MIDRYASQMESLAEKLESAVDDAQGDKVPEVDQFYKGLSQWKRDRQKMIGSLTAGLTNDPSKQEELDLSEFVER